MSSTTRAFATLPPGTVSPVMASTIIESSGRRQLVMAHLRRRATRDAVSAAQSAAEAASAAAESAAKVVDTAPSDPTAGQVVDGTRAAQKNALEQARQADDAAYHLSRLRRLEAQDLPQRRFPSAPLKSPSPRPEKSEASST